MYNKQDGFDRTTIGARNSLDELLPSGATWSPVQHEVIVETKMSIFSIVDDKYVPLYRVIWVAATPHFCGADDCEREGHYEVRLEQGESVWAKTLAERDAMLEALEHWQGGPAPDDEGWTD